MPVSPVILAISAAADRADDASAQPVAAAGAVASSPRANPNAEAASDGRTELATLVDAAARAEDYAGRSKSAATIKAYASGWRDFLNFCEQRDASPLPASEQTVAAYLAALADGRAKAAD